MHADSVGSVIMIIEEKIILGKTKRTEHDKYKHRNRHVLDIYKHSFKNQMNIYTRLLEQTSCCDEQQSVDGRINERFRRNLEKKTKLLPIFR